MIVSPVQPARKQAGKIAPVVSLKSRTAARSEASADVFSPLHSPHDSQHDFQQAKPRVNLHRVRSAIGVYEYSNFTYICVFLKLCNIGFSEVKFEKSLT